MKKKGLNSFQLKCIGVILMTIDHICLFFFDSININLLRIIGRIAAPLFLYITVNSIHYTKNRIKYLLRLYLANLLIYLFALLITYFSKNRFEISGDFSILSTFFYVALIISIIEYILRIPKNYLFKRICSIILSIILIFVPILFLFAFGEYNLIYMAIIPNILTVPYSPFFILMGLCWYFRKNNIEQAITLVLFSVISYLGNNVCNHSSIWLFPGFFNSIQYYMVLFLPFIFIYNGEKGKSWKLFFYIHYPIHVFTFMLLN